MNQAEHRLVKQLIDETSYAYDSCHGLNADYAEFASMALADFKAALKNPDLTARQLRRIIRQAYLQHRNRDDNWSAFIAMHVAKSSNQNLAEATHSDLETIYEKKTKKSD